MAAIIGHFSVAPPLLERLTLTVLKITSTSDTVGTTLKIEGRIVGGWVDELSRAVAAARSADYLALDLSQVTFVDAAGAVFLRNAAANGIDLTNSSDFVAGLIRGGHA